MSPTSGGVDGSPRERELLRALRKLRRAMAATQRGHAVAIIGAGCRFPGEVWSPDGLWRLLLSGEEAVASPPRDRAETAQDAWSESLPAGGRGGYLTGVDQFDASFFGISPAEANVMDPQHRLLLEVAWAALEHAAVPPDRLMGADVGVYVGSMGADYRQLVAARQDVDPPGPYTVTGALLDGTAAGRLSHLFGFVGPSMVVDTACSSSLLAVHLACRSLASEECSLALAGGVNLILTPTLTEAMSQAAVLSPRGRCSTFDVAADGFVRSEGCGLVVLKRLDDALRDGDRVWAVIRGSAVNSDGRGGALTAPKGSAQRAVMEQALRCASLSTNGVGLVESHGTGTALGDPLEVRALQSVYGAREGQRIPVVSLKTSLGHMEAASGVGALIKGMMMLAREEVPPHLHLTAINPHLPFDELSFVFPGARVPWVDRRQQRTLGISSFGLSGTNVHLLLSSSPPAVSATEQEAPGVPRRGAGTGGAGATTWPGTTVDRPAHLLTLSARDDAALRALCEAYLERLDGGGHSLADVCHAANVNRAHHPHRLSVVARTSAGAREQLRRQLEGGITTSVWRGRANGQPEICFLFTGHGSSYAGMGRSLWQSSPPFRSALAAYAEQLAGEIDLPLEELLFSPAGQSAMRRMSNAQPALFAFQLALTRLWDAWGVRPAMVLGHSAGEYAAACVAEVFSVEDGLRLMAARGRLLDSLDRNGTMMTVAAPAADLRAAVQRAGDRVSVAAINGASDTVLSGERACLEQLRQELLGAGIGCRPLNIDVASHSPLMDPMLDELESAVRGVTLRPARLPHVSNVTGREASPSDLCRASYWRRHTREPVLFHRGLQTAYELGCRVFLEIGPGAGLTALGAVALPDEGLLWLSSLGRERDDWDQMLQAVAELYVAGAAIDWRGFDSPYHRKRVAVPTYPFQRQRYWFGAHLDHDHITRTPHAAAAPRTPPAGSARPPTPQVLDLRWEPMPLPSPRHHQPGARWLLLSDRTLGLGAAVEQALRRAGLQCVVAQSGDGSGRTPSGAIVADPTDPDAMDQLVRGATDDGNRPLEGVLVLWNLDAPPLTDGIAALERGQREICGTLLHLVQSLSRARQPTGRLWLVSNRGHTRHTDPVRPEQCTAWGMGRVIAAEMPQLHCSNVDVAAEEPDAAAPLVRLLLGCDDEDEVMLRQGQRYVRRLVPAVQRAAGPALRMAPHGCALVVGGASGLGAHLCRRLLARGTRRVVLMSRHEPDQRAQQALQELRRSGLELVLMRGDATRPEDVERVLTRVRAEHGPLRAVFYSAAVVHDGMLEQQTLTQMMGVLAPKVLGATNVHRALGDDPLDLFLIFSSATALLGKVGVGAYPAGNAFLDGLAHLRRAQGLAGLSVNWGAWSGVGAVERLSADERHQLEQEAPLMSPDVALDLLERVPLKRTAQVAIVQVAWQRYAQLHGRTQGWPLVRHLTRQGETVDLDGARSGSTRAPSPPLVRRLRHTPDHERLPVLIEHVRGVLTHLLALADERSLFPKRPLMELGATSLTLLELRKALARDSGLPLPATMAYRYPTVEAIAQRLDLLLGGEGSDGAHGPSRGAPRPAADAVAIIGLGCRLPCGIDDPTQFWTRLQQGLDAVQPIPRQRWGAEVQLGSAGWDRGHASLLDAPLAFDARFFGISPAEADAIDPEQRLLLEVAWATLEDAGVAADALEGTSVGIFVGAGGNDYRSLLLAPERRSTFDPFTVTGGTPSAAAGRLSHLLGVCGPSYVVDTACSSSLVAVHLACQSLRAGECELALVGGANLLLREEPTVVLAKAGLMAPDGRCKAFDAAANGFVRGEGCVMVALKPLSRAVEDRDSIYAVIRSTAVNHDGRSTGLTAPNVNAQVSLIRRALAAGHVSSQQIEYVEAHGTGTELGDPVEAEALMETVATPQRRGALAVGSVKTNVGHLEGAAGAVGLLKTILALHHEELPPHLHLERYNPHLAVDHGTLVVPPTRVAWPAVGTRRAGVSAFGVTGTNAHVVLEQAPREPVRPRPAGPAHRLAVVSAATRRGLTHQLQRLSQHLRGHGRRLRLDDLCYTLARGRVHREHRAALVVRSRSELCQGLDLAATAQAQDATGQLSTLGPGDLGFVFAGEGWCDRAAIEALDRSQPAFAAALDRVDQAVTRVVGPSLRAVLSGADRSREGVDLWTRLFRLASDYAAAALLRGLGLAPAAVVGVGHGELSAACVAGSLELDQAVVLLKFLARPRPGAVGAQPALAVCATGSCLQHAVERSGVTVRPMAHLGPRHRLVVGSPPSLQRLAVELERAGCCCQQLELAVVGDGSQPHDASNATERPAVTWSAPRVPWLSASTGGEVVCDPAAAAQWPSIFAGPRALGPAMRRLRERRVSRLVLLGATAGTTALVRRAWPGPWTDLLALPAAGRPEQDGTHGLLEVLARLFMLGWPVDFTGLSFGAAPRKVSLPAYAFQRRQHWIDRGSESVNGEAAGAESEQGPELQDEALLAILRTVLEVTGCRPEELGPETDLLSLGLDSLAAITLKERLERQTQLELPATLVLDCPSVRAIARYVGKLSASAASELTGARSGAMPG